MVTHPSSARVILLAAGRGSRLRPLTDERPKALVEFAGRPLLAHQLDTLLAVGVEHVTVVTGYKARMVERFLEDYHAALDPARRRATTLDTAHNPAWDETDMVESLFCAEAAFPDPASGEDLIVAYADLVYEPRVLEALLDAEGPVATTVDENWEPYWQARMEDPLDDAETLRVDDEGRVAAIGGEAGSADDVDGHYMGLVKVDGEHVPAFSEAYHRLAEATEAEGIGTLHMTDLIGHLIDDGWTVRAAGVENGWLEFDTVEELETYEAMRAEGSLHRFLDPKALEGAGPAPPPP